jgi:hypothetical protein
MRSRKSVTFQLIRKPKRKTCQFQVGYQLGVMHWEERLNNFVLDKNHTIHVHVQSVPSTSSR